MVPLDKHSILKPYWSLRGIDFEELNAYPFNAEFEDILTIEAGLE